MKRSILIVALLAFTGCATPRYVTNWQEVKVGMSTLEVKDLLGTPTFQSVVSQEVAKSPFGSRIFGPYHKRWDYWKRGWSWLDLDGMFGPRADAFVVYFDSEGEVVRLRLPIENRQPTTDSTLSTEDAPSVEE